MTGKSQVNIKFKFYNFYFTQYEDNLPKSDLINKALFLNNLLGLELTLQERRAVETMLRTHVQYLQEQASSAIMSSPSTSSQSSKTEELLRQRVENLLEALDNVIRNSEARHKQSKELIDDLKKANRYVITY